MKELHTCHIQIVRFTHLKFLVICGCFMDHLLLSSGSTLKQMGKIFNSTEENAHRSLNYFLITQRQIYAAYLSPDP